MTVREPQSGNTYVRLLALFKKLYKQHQARRQGRASDAQTVASDELRALIEWRLAVEEYLNIKLDRALDPLRPTLVESELTLVRACVWEHVRSQPVWLQIIGELRKIGESSRATDAGQGIR